MEEEQQRNPFAEDEQEAESQKASADVKVDLTED